ncbi:MAG: hypothetical protein MJZ73_08720 [Bacteroidaceae bacterium]|nr:hypothetical protein [Bacteroidaceae bacterium]
MLLKSDTYYIEYYIHHSEECAEVNHYLEVQEEGSSMHSYFIEYDGINYEAAGFVGEIDEEDAGTQISKEQFILLENNIKTTTQNILNFLSSNTLGRTDAIKVGDYFYNYGKIYRVWEIDDDKVMVSSMYIGSYGIQNIYFYDPEWEKRTQIFNEQTQQIDKSVVLKAVSMVESLVNTLRSEVKDRVNEIEVFD